MTQETFKKELVFTDVPTYAALWTKLVGLSIEVEIIANREDELFKKPLKEYNEALKTLLKQM